MSLSYLALSHRGVGPTPTRRHASARDEHLDRGDHSLAAGAETRGAWFACTSASHAYLFGMATTVTVDIDAQLLERLRALHPGKTDREMVERLAAIELGRDALVHMQHPDADPEEVVVEEAVRAVHEVRRQAS